MVQSIIDYVNQFEEKYAGRVAFRWIDEATDTIQEKNYAEYKADIFRYAAYLKNETPDIAGKHVAMMAENSYHYAVALMGTILTGAVAVPLNIRESNENLTRMLSFADCEIVYADKNQLESNPAISVFTGKKCMMEGYTSVSCEWEPAHELTLGSVAIMMFTSGTTAASKCVMISQDNLMAALKYMYGLHDDVVSFVKKDQLRAMQILPFYHIIGIISLLIWTEQGELINMCNNMRYLQRDIVRLPSDYLVVVPMILDMWSKIIRSGKKERLGDTKFVLSGGAAIPPEQMQLFVENDIGLIQSYGMTETSGFGFYNFVNQSKKYISNGRAGNGASVRIDNGEICIKSDLVMVGYYKNDEATAETIVDGWLHTGDMGYMDEEGYIYLTGRKKNLIILSSGENVSPEELEGLVSVNEAVKEVVVKEKDGKICAEIFCDADKQEEIRSFVTEVNRQLAMYKRMTLVEFREEPFPRTASGKIKRV